MRTFRQLSYQEREKIYRLLCEGKSCKEIGVELERHKSTIAREIRRNSDKRGYYLYPGQAQQQTDARKNRKKNKIESNQKLKSYIMKKLKLRWAPASIAGRWNLENSDNLCKETIYSWIYSEQGKALGAHQFLVRAKKKRGIKRKVSRCKIKHRVSVHLRPEGINNRSEMGHYECDLIFNKGSMSKNICTLIERTTRKSIIIYNKNKCSNTVIDAIIRCIKKLKLKVLSITFDNGSEFADHWKLNRLGIKTYFCDPGAPWQKGAIEHLNSMLRRYLPFDLESKKITRKFVKKVGKMINDIPRASLGFQTPTEVAQGVSP